jgi:integrase
MAIRPRHLTREQVDRLLAHLVPGNAMSPTVGLALFAGLRIGEIALCRRSDITRALSSGMFHVRKEVAKGGIPRTIPVSPRLAEILKEWLLRHDTVTVKHLSLWSCSYRTVQRRFAAHVLSIGLPRVTPHDLRHTFGAALYAHFRDLSLVQVAMGHHRLSSTLVYVHVDGYIQGEIDKAYESYTTPPIRRTYR